MYQEVCFSNISSGIIKDMRFDPRNKWRKAFSWKLDTSCYQGLMEKLDTSSIYWELQFQISQIWISAHDDLNDYGFSLSTTLDIYKTYFKSYQLQKQRPRTHILCVKLLRLCTIGFSNQLLPDLHCIWSEELCSQQQSIKLLELDMY